MAERQERNAREDLLAGVEALMDAGDETLVPAAGGSTSQGEQGRPSTAKRRKAQEHGELEPKPEENAEEKAEDKAEEKPAENVEERQAEPQDEDEITRRRIQSAVDRQVHRLRQKLEAEFQEREAALREELAKANMTAEEFARWKQAQGDLEEVVKQAAIARTAAALQMLQDELLGLVTTAEREEIEDAANSGKIKTFRELAERVLDARTQRFLAQREKEIREAVLKELAAEEAGGPPEPGATASPIRKQANWRTAPATDLIAQGLEEMLNRR